MLFSTHATRHLFQATLRPCGALPPPPLPCALETPTAPPSLKFAADSRRWGAWGGGWAEEGRGGAEKSVEGWMR